ncbi:MAG: hypothetical protein ACI9W6_000960 [Motiliproteus sp.]|jgi:hypothetical protein
MSLLDVLKGFFGETTANTTAPAAAQAEAEAYQGFLITPAPIKKGNLYRVAATISKGEQTHQLIRADEMSNLQECTEFSLRKARLMIDQQGDRLF